MPMFNISCTHRYLVIKLNMEWKKTNSFEVAKEIAIKFHDATIYEKLGKKSRADWFPHMDYYNGKFFEVID
ncbi:hypothetical protein HQ584_01755 [Patescibacteria group bacterium]|nr:hypothetical protein [Patescibacteria group bacterium]